MHARHIHDPSLYYNDLPLLVYYITILIIIIVSIFNTRTVLVQQQVNITGQKMCKGGENNRHPKNVVVRIFTLQIFTLFVSFYIHLNRF